MTKRSHGVDGSRRIGWSGTTSRWLRRRVSIGRIVGTLDRSQGGFVPANGVCDEAAAAVRSGSMASSCAKRPKVGRPCGVTPTGCPSSSSSLCRRWLLRMRRRGSATTSIGVRGVRPVRASTFAASRRVEAIRAASCCPGEQPAGRPCPVLCAPSSRWGRS